MPTMTEKDTIKALTTHYIDGAFVESHGREVMDIIKPNTGKVIARVTLGDEEDTRRAIAAAKLASWTMAAHSVRLLFDVSRVGRFSYRPAINSYRAGPKPGSVGR